MAKIFRVGGYVRDRLLGLKSKDIDFTFVCEDSQTVEGGWIEMSSWMKINGFEIFLETPDCFTIRAKFPKDHKNAGLVADFVMARKEVGYTYGTRRPILELGTLEDDLIRRDFTLNAMAEDEDGNLIDLFGGREDLAKGLLRTPLPAGQTMMDDPLRILRCWRFSITKGFTVHPDILKASKQPGILEKLETVVSGERIREEMFKMFKHDTIKTIKLLQEIESEIPGMMSILFKNGLHLEPTFRK